MNTKYLLVLSALGAMAGCVSAPATPPALAGGTFVQFACADGKRFGARASADGSSVRVRAHHGSAELDRKDEGVYEGEGYRLVTRGADAYSLTHAGKPQGANCKPA